MVTVYLICAVIGSTILVCQLALMIFGIGGDHDVGGHDIGGGDHDLGGGDHDVGGHDAAGHGGVGHDHAQAGAHDSSWFFSVLSFRALVAAAAFFGLGGMVGHTGGLSAYPTFLSALIAGCAAMFVVAWLLHLLQGLGSEGNMYIEMALGAPGSVYLSIPGHGEGRGKVTVRVRDRAMEYQAVTQGEALSTGTPVVVVGVAGPDTVQVAPATDDGKRGDD